MKEIAEKLQNVERQLTGDMGPFWFFALVRSGEAPDKRDVVASAPWIADDRMAALRRIAERLKQHVEPQELLSIGRIVVLDPSDPLIKTTQLLLSGVQGSLVDFRANIVNGIFLPDMFIITSQRQIPVQNPTAGNSWGHSQTGD